MDAEGRRRVAKLVKYKTNDKNLLLPVCVLKTEKSERRPLYLLASSTSNSKRHFMLLKRRRKKERRRPSPLLRLLWLCLVGHFTGFFHWLARV